LVPRVGVDATAYVIADSSRTVGAYEDERVLLAAPLRRYCDAVAVAVDRYERLQRLADAGDDDRLGQRDRVGHTGRDLRQEGSPRTVTVSDCRLLVAARVAHRCWR
jgi:hypothetical protein